MKEWIPPSSPLAQWPQKKLEHGPMDVEIFMQVFLLSCGFLLEEDHVPTLELLL